MGVENIKMEPMYMYVGEDQAQVQKISCVADVADSLDGKYAFFYDPNNGTKRYFWFNTSGGSAVDPAIAGYTAHVVAITTGASAQAVASALQAVLDAVTGYDASVSGYEVTLTNTASGYCLPAHDAQASASQTEFGFSMITVGDSYESIGLLDGNIEISGLSRSPVDITTHQTGSSIVGQIFSGFGNPEMAATLKEVTTANLEKLVRYAGGSYLPVGGSNKLVGGGSLGQFKAPQYTKVILHPVRLDVADKVNDYAFWKCTIDLDSVSFSGEDLLVLPVTIKAFNDSTKPAAISTWVYGDWSQSLT